MKPSPSPNPEMHYFSDFTIIKHQVSQFCQSNQAKHPVISKEVLPQRSLGFVLQPRSVSVLCCGFIFSPFTSYRSKSDKVRCGVQPEPGYHTGLSCSCHPHGEVRQSPWRWEAGKSRASHTWHTRKLICKSALGTTSECFFWGSLCGSPLPGLVLHRPGLLPGGKEGLRKPFPKRVTINLLLHSMQGCFSLAQAIPSLFTFS